MISAEDTAKVPVFYATIFFFEAPKNKRVI